MSVSGVPGIATLKTRASKLDLCSVLAVSSAGDWHVVQACDHEMDGVADCLVYVQQVCKLCVRRWRCSQWGEVFLEVGMTLSKVVAQK